MKKIFIIFLFGFIKFCSTSSKTVASLEIENQELCKACEVHQYKEIYKETDYHGEKEIIKDLLLEKQLTETKEETFIEVDISEVIPNETLEIEISIPPLCGNSEIDEDEVCDDGDKNGLYGYCKIDCSGIGPHCGDGILDQPYEECDLGENNSSYGSCSDLCKVTNIKLPYYIEDIEESWIDNPPKCSRENWFVKYLWYRIRLFGNGTFEFPGFLSSGPDQGQSIPASFREPHVNCANDWWLSYAKCEQHEGSGKIRWGDATVWLGDYIAVLASEYKVFDILGFKTDKTIEALYYALNAINRLDEYADILYGVTPKRDGFFIRDDVPSDFYKLPNGDQRFPGYNCVQSAGSCGTPDINEGYFTSQDQMIGLIFGLAMVYRFLPDGLKYNNVNLKFMAREIIHRFVNHLRTNDWKVTDPLGNHPPDKWGGNAIGFSNKLAKVANLICGKDFGVDDYRDFKSKTLGETIFDGLELIWSETHDYNRDMAFKLITILNEWNSDKVAKKALDDAKEIFAFVHALHNNIPVSKSISLWRIESLLTSAPCHGPCHNTPGCEEAKGWKGDDRLKDPKSRAGNKHYWRAEFNGLDYMLLHNLYFIYQKGKYSYKIPMELSKKCENFPNLSDIINGNELKSTVYDPNNSCSYIDMKLYFCGRSWASWIADALTKKVNIFVGTYKFDCSYGVKCNLMPVSKIGSDSSDLILGTIGNDIIYGWDGDDCIYGFEGNDILIGNDGADEIHGGPGDDEIYGDDKFLNLTGGPDILWGDDGNDYLKGGPHKDELYGGKGNDKIYGDSEDDFIEGDEGDDYLIGDAGDDTIIGGQGNDEIHGDSGDDVLDGEDGNDKLDGDSGDDIIMGGKGNNFLKGGYGNDRLFGDLGDYDILCGNGGDDELWGNWDGKDKCLGGGWFLGGKDSVNGCEDGSAKESECTDSAFENWKP